MVVKDYSKTSKVIMFFPFHLNVPEQHLAISCILCMMPLVILDLAALGVVP